MSYDEKQAPLSLQKSLDYFLDYFREQARLKAYRQPEALLNKELPVHFQSMTRNRKRNIRRRLAHG